MVQTELELTGENVHPLSENTIRKAGLKIQRDGSGPGVPWAFSSQSAPGRAEKSIFLATGMVQTRFVAIEDIS